MKRLLSALILLALIVSLAACGGGGGGGSAGTGNIRIALMAPMTGSMSSQGNQFQKAAQYKVDEINNDGGVDGRMVELVVYDDKMDPKESANIAQLIVTDETILACIGSYSSSCCLAAIPIFEKVDLAMITPSASSETLTQDNTVMYKMWTSIPVYVSALANWLVTKGGFKTYASIYVYNDWGIGVQEAFEKYVTQVGGEMIGSEVCYDTDTDFKTQLTKIKELNPDVFCVFTFYANGAVIVQQARALGIESQYVSTGTLNDPEFIAMAGEYAQGMYAVNEFALDDQRPSVQAFIESYRQLSGGEDPGAYSGNSYDCVGVIIHAGKANGFTRSGINSGLKELKGYVGVTGELTFTNGEVLKPQVLIQLKGDFFSYVDEAPTLA